MKTIFQKETVEELISRINKLTPQSSRLWGTMNVEQMLAHCSVGFKTATGEIKPKVNLFLRVIGSFFKSMTTDDKPFRKGSPTNEAFKISNPKQFEIEKEELIQHINKLHYTPESNFTDYPHAFFGKLSPLQWSSLCYKHTDHHLRQFGV